MIATWGASKSLAARVRDIFAKFGTNAHMYLAGTEITQGFTPGNYVESTGVTPATVDQPVGLVKDAANVTGGIDASQSTSGFRPVERRGIVNYGLHSNDLANSAWTKVNVTIGSNVADAPNGNGNADSIISGAITASFYVSQNYTVTATPHTVFAYIKPNGFTKFGIRESTASGAYATFDTSSVSVIATNLTTAEIVYVGSDTYIVVMKYTPGAGSLAHSFFIMDSGYASGSPHSYSSVGDGVKGAIVSGLGIAQGTLTASKILAMGGIPLTTTAAASSSIGNPWLQFDVIDDKMVLTIPAGYESATIIKASKTSVTTQHAQNLVGTLNLNTELTCCFIFATQPNAADLAVVQTFANQRLVA